MKSSLIAWCVGLLVGFSVVSPVSAHPRACVTSGHGYVSTHTSGGFWGPQRYAVRWGINDGAYYRPYYGYSNYYYGGSSFRVNYGYASAPVTYVASAPVVIKEAQVPAVTITTWNDENLTNLGIQKFRELYRKLDADARDLRVTIVSKDYQTTKGVRLVEKVKFIAKWVVVEKDQAGHEREFARTAKFKLKFDDYGEFAKYDD